MKKLVESAGKPPDARQALERITIQVSSTSLLPPSSSSSNRPANNRAAGSAAALSVEVPSSPAMRGPQETYRSEVSKALVDAMLDHGAALGSKKARRSPSRPAATRTGHGLAQATTIRRQSRSACAARICWPSRRGKSHAKKRSAVSRSRCFNIRNMRVLRLVVLRFPSPLPRAAALTSISRRAWRWSASAPAGTMQASSTVRTRSFRWSTFKLKNVSGAKLKVLRPTPSSGRWATPRSGAAAMPSARLRWAGTGETTEAITLRGRTAIRAAGPSGDVHP